MRLFYTLLCLTILMSTPVCAEENKGLPEIVIGKADAPVTMISYSALTCGHCAQFHETVLPKIKEKYVDPGLVRVVLRDFPGDQLAVFANQLAWCRGELKYQDFVNLLFSKQEEWLTADNPEEALTAIALQNGMTKTQCEKCTKDPELLNKIVETRLEAQKKYKIEGTPTIVINTKVYPEALTFEEFEEIVNPLLNPKSEKEVKKKS